MGSTGTVFLIIISTDKKLCDLYLFNIFAIASVTVQIKTLTYPQDQLQAKEADYADKNINRRCVDTLFGTIQMASPSVDIGLAVPDTKVAAERENQKGTR